MCHVLRGRRRRRGTMGAAAEVAFRCGPVVNQILLCLPVEDLLSCARFDALWEEATLPLLAKRLRFFALLEDKNDISHVSEPFAGELQNRLRVSRRAWRHPAVAIVLCSDKHFDTGCLASCFPDDTSVVRIDVSGPTWMLYRGLEETRAARLCVLVLFESLGAEFETEWSPFVSCRRPETRAVLFNRLARRIDPSTYKVTFHHPRTNEPARFAFYATSAFTVRAFINSPRMDYMASCVLWTPCLRVLNPPCRSRSLPHAFWGAVTFGENVRAASAKYKGFTTVFQMTEHLEIVRSGFGNLDNALVLVFQEDHLNKLVMKAIRDVFAGAAAILGTACSVGLDESSYVFVFEVGEDIETSDTLETPVIVTVLNIPLK
ncbi:uncharacterized protein LOC144097384 [Amblyomma americanum]